MASWLFEWMQLARTDLSSIQKQIRSNLSLLCMANAIVIAVPALFVKIRWIERSLAAPMLR